MKRRAILIESSNVAGQNDLPGARVDIKNWQNFLKSDLGGAWNESDIRILNKPTSSDVSNALAVTSDYYCFVVFSGHGSDGFIVLNDYFSNYPVGKLKADVKKSTIIIDSCRGVERAERNALVENMSIKQARGIVTAANSLEGKETIFASAQATETLTLKYVRTMTLSGRWETALNGSSEGIVEMQACSKGQYAGEDPAAGGYYTSLLLQSAEEWNVRNADNKIFTTKSAHDYAAANLPPQQTPEYKPTWLSFPFAVKL